MTATYDSLATTTLTTATATVTFNSISQAYTDLILVCQVGQSTSTNSLRIRFNNDTATNYSYIQMGGNGSSVSSGRASNTDSGLASETVGSTTLGLLSIIQIYNYSNTTTFKSILGRGQRGDSAVDLTSSLYRSTSAITRIDLAMGAGFPTNNFASGSTFTLYGIKAE